MIVEGYGAHLVQRFMDAIVSPRAVPRPLVRPDRMVGRRATFTNASRSQKSHARNILLKAVKAGRVKRPASCATCDASRTEAHHADYSRPLDVIWLCRTCHSRLHSHIYVAQATAHVKQPLISVASTRQLTLAQMDALDLAVHQHDVSR